MPGTSASLEQPVIRGRARYSGSNFFSFIRTPRASTRKAASEAKGSATVFSLVIQAIGLRSVMRDVDFVRHLPFHLHLVDLGKLLQAVVDLGEIDRKNVQSLPQPARFQDLVALQRAVGLDRDRAQPVVGIIEEEAAQARAHAVVKAGANRDHEHDLGDDEQECGGCDDAKRGAPGP